MAITDPYADVTAYRAHIKKTDTGSDPAILTDLKSVTNFLARDLGRFFTKDEEDVDRVYVADGYWKTLYTDDIVSVDEIAFDLDGSGDFATELTSADYELTPRNAALGPEPRPYTAIELTTHGAYGTFSPGVRVQVTGIFGWPDVPEAIKRATIELTAILRLESPRAQATVSEIGQIVGMSPMGKGIVTDLRRTYLKVQAFV